MHDLAIVTGGSRGIGFAAAKQLAAQGYDLLLVSSRKGHLTQAAAELEAKGARVHTAQVDFADLASVRAFGSHFRDLNRDWKVLINNAGIKIQSDAAATIDRFERHMGINHLSHFLLTKLLLPHAATGARVTAVASIVARVASPDLFDAQTTSQRYAASKLANLCFALELNKRLSESGSSITANAAHPGFTMADPYGTKMTRLGEKLFAQSADAGALPIVWAATKGQPGGYYGPNVFELWGKTERASIPKLATSQDFRDALWHRSEQLVGESFAI